MSWKDITLEEVALCNLMVKWLTIRKEWNPNDSWMPTEPDIIKSVLFERLRNGLEPLPYPPPVGYSCPWYAVVEARGPHFIQEKADGYGLWISYPIDKDLGGKLARKEGCMIIHIFQHCYRVVKTISDMDYLIKDVFHDSPWVFRFWYDSSYKNDRGYIKIRGGWFIQNMDFVNEASS